MLYFYLNSKVSQPVKIIDINFLLLWILGTEGYQCSGINWVKHVTVLHLETLFLIGIHFTLASIFVTLRLKYNPSPFFMMLKQLKCLLLEANMMSVLNFNVMVSICLVLFLLWLTLKGDLVHVLKIVYQRIWGQVINQA